MILLFLLLAFVGGGIQGIFDMRKKSKEADSLAGLIILVVFFVVVSAVLCEMFS